MRVLLDTHILIAAFIAHGTCHELLEHCFHHHQIVTSEPLLQECRRTLARKFRFSRPDVREVVQAIRAMVQMVQPEPLPSPVCRDEDDDEVLAATMGAGADCVITGDEDLLVLREYKNVPILRPRQFWRFEQERY